MGCHFPPFSRSLDGRLVFGQGIAVQSSGESRHAAAVDARLNVAVPHALEINHGRGDIAVSHSLLQGPDVDAVLQMTGRIGMPEFMQKSSAAERAFGAAVDAGAS